MKIIHQLSPQWSIQKNPVKWIQINEGDIIINEKMSEEVKGFMHTWCLMFNNEIVLQTSTILPDEKLSEEQEEELNLVQSKMLLKGLEQKAVSFMYKMLYE